MTTPSPPPPPTTQQDIATYLNSVSPFAIEVGFCAGVFGLKWLSKVIMNTITGFSPILSSFLFLGLVYPYTALFIYICCGQVNWRNIALEMIPLFALVGALTVLRIILKIKFIGKIMAIVAILDLSVVLIVVTWTFFYSLIYEIEGNCIPEESFLVWILETVWGGIKSLF